MSEVKILSTQNPVKATVVAIPDATTAKVEVQRTVPHAQYFKRQHLVSNFHVHTNGKKLNIGDKVTILPSRRFSKNKSWRVVEIIIN